MDQRDRTFPEIPRNHPGPWTVCPTCGGRGQHVNPDIDRYGLTGDQIAELGEDFARDYRQGVHDVPCRQCGGLRVVPDTEDYREECEGLHEVDLERDAEDRYLYGPQY